MNVLATKYNKTDDSNCIDWLTVVVGYVHEWPHFKIDFLLLKIFFI